MTLREVTGAEVELVPGALYYAKVHLTGLEATFGTSGAVADKLKGAGFGGVTVWSGDPGVIPDKPESEGATFWARGTWAGADVKKALPHQVVRVWVEEEDAKPNTPPPAQKDEPDPVLRMPVQEVVSEKEGDDWTAVALLVGLLFMMSQR